MPTIALGFRPATPPDVEAIPHAADLATYDAERMMLVTPDGDALIDTDREYQAGTATKQYPGSRPGVHWQMDDETPEPPLPPAKGK
jgi:hypothetical protein